MTNKPQRTGGSSPPKPPPTKPKGNKMSPKEYGDMLMRKGR